MFISKITNKTLSFLPQIVAALFLAGFAVFAWTEPSQAPPGGQTAQTKQGDLTLAGALKVEGDITDKLGNIIYNSTIGKIERSKLPF